MSFNEKLQNLRKEKRLSQEQLAEQLNVSRQSVSKWESGQAYPEMDKLIALSKIFNITLDELTNDTNLEEIKDSKEKNPFNDLFVEIQELINKSVKMFSSMTGDEVLKLILIMILVGIGVSLIRIPIDYIYNMGSDLFFTFGSTPGKILTGFWSFILDACYLVAAFLIMFYVYKVQYLDKFDGKKIIEKKTTKVEKKETIEEIKEELKEEPVVKEEVAEDKKARPSSILTTLWNIILFGIKIISFFILMPFMIAFVIFVALFVISISLIFKNIVLIGIIFVFASLITLDKIFLEIGWNFITSKKLQAKKLFIEGLAGFAFLGIGIAISTIELSEYKIIDGVPSTFEQTVYTEEMSFEDDMFFNTWYKQVNYVSDETMKDTMKIDVSYYKDLSKPSIVENNGKIQVYSMDDEFDLTVVKKMLESCRNKELYSFDSFTSYIITITTSSENIKKMDNNYKTYYKNEEKTESRLNYYEQRIEELENEIYELQDSSKDDELAECKEELQSYKDRIRDLLD